jgi:hypothetical protein
MCLPFLNLSVRYDALLRGWCVAYVRDVSVCVHCFTVEAADNIHSAQTDSLLYRLSYLVTPKNYISILFPT